MWQYLYDDLFMKCIQTQNGKKLAEAPAYIYVVALPVLGGLTWKLVFLNKKPTCVSVSLCVPQNIKPLSSIPQCMGYWVFFQYIDYIVTSRRS